MMKKHSSTRAAAAGLSLMLALCTPIGVLAEESPSPSGNYVQEQERLADGLIEYDEIEQLVKKGYGPIKSAYDMAAGMKEDQGSIAAAMRVMADDLKSQARDARELAKEQTGMEQIVSKMTAQALSTSASDLIFSASQQDHSLAKVSSTERSVDRQANMLIMTVESLVNQYQQLMTQREMAAKAVELSETADQLQKTSLAQGIAVGNDVVSAAADLTTARAQLDSLDSGLWQMKKMICTFTGKDMNTDPQIGAVPSPDVSVIGQIDVAADKEKAVGNNYNLISMRSAAGGGMTDLQTRTTKTTTQTANKLRNVEYGENQLRSRIQTLYDTLLQKQAAWDAAQTAWQSAQLTWNAAQIQKANGSLSQIQFLQMELAYLQAKSNYTCTELALQQAIRNYHWAVRGVEVAV